MNRNIDNETGKFIQVDISCIKKQLFYTQFLEMYKNSVILYILLGCV